MFSPFTITVTHQDKSTLTVNVSDSHELHDKLSELKSAYPDSLIEYAPRKYED